MQFLAGGYGAGSMATNARRKALPVRWLVCFLTAACAGGAPGPGVRPPAAGSDAVPIVATFTLPSAALGEDRTVHVHVPPGVDPQARLPVLYALDGGLDEDLPHIVATVDRLVAERAIAPLRLVGIPNTQRRRDLTEPTAIEEERQIAPVVGGAAAFRQFVVDELIPAVEARHACTGQRALLGESLAGAFVVGTFLRAPAVFERCIAISPSLWWNGGALLAEAPALLAAAPTSPRVLWFTSADELNIVPRTEQLATLLQRAAPRGLVWSYHPMPHEQHGTIFRAAEATAYRAVLWAGEVATGAR